MATRAPTLAVESSLFAGGARRIGGVDEVGRGSPAGPVSCAVVVVDASIGPIPTRLRDSKALTAATRESIVPEIIDWARAYAIGHAEPHEVDSLGLTAALRRAAIRAFTALDESIDLVLLDGRHDWLSPPRQLDLVSGFDGALVMPPVVTRIKADVDCASVAAASVLAKVARDGLMLDLAQSHPGYGWEANKGYGTSQHLAAIRDLGLTDQHRHTWHLSHRQN